MNIPDKEIEQILFTTPVDIDQLEKFQEDPVYLSTGAFQDIHWLNTPGPLYTSFTDNCGTGPDVAVSNVGVDENFREVIFKQPVNRKEVKESLIAAAIDPFGAYHSDGNENWNPFNILQWWNKSEERVNYILDRYKIGLNLPTDHQKGLNIPVDPVCKNYRNWLDFYQFGMKEYLEWYITRISNQPVSLPSLNFDWTKKEEFDQLFKDKK